MEDFSKREDIYSQSVRAGKRTYFFDVKETKNKELYLTVTESKKQFQEGKKPFFEKHKIFLYKEDFEKFGIAFKEAIAFIEERQPYIPSEEDEQQDVYTDIEFEDLEK
ncbi:MAG: DUF3276 family protein [Bacteroidales bacterium]|nr:DUF3276 family protein [Bacteroidales bacterium]